MLSPLSAQHVPLLHAQPWRSEEAAEAQALAQAKARAKARAQRSERTVKARARVKARAQRSERAARARAREEARAKSPSGAGLAQEETRGSGTRGHPSRTSRGSGLSPILGLMLR